MSQALIFDMGGVLAHDVWENLLLDKKIGVAANLDLNAVEVRRVAEELWDDFAHRPADKEMDWQKLERKYWDTFIKHFQLSESADYFISLTERFIRPVTGMIELLERLHSRGVRLAICSNNTEFWFERQMRQLDLARFFQSAEIVLSSRIGVSKDSPKFEMFEAVLSGLNVAKSNCTFVDDREVTILRAVEFGIAGIIFPSHSERGARYLEALLKRMRIL